MPDWTASKLPAESSGATLIDGDQGSIEVYFDAPSGRPVGVACIAHPQPLLGGSATHKIPALLAHACRDARWYAVRPNFRGVGKSSGTYDHGEGEAADIRRVVDVLRRQFEGLPLALLGFSFGAFVQAGVARQLQAEGVPAARVVLAGMPAGIVEGGRDYDTGDVPKESLIIHGELDQQVPLGNVLAWAHRHAHAVLVVPGADHFFRGRLPMLRDAALKHLWLDGASPRRMPS
ncbi:MAG: alpha/beta hydrolase [Burkholderiales bacterium]|nr:alpha/beta hydrolase [Burkholderiales bacterium]